MKPFSQEPLEIGPNKEFLTCSETVTGRRLLKVQQEELRLDIRKNFPPWWALGLLMIYIHPSRQLGYVLVLGVWGCGKHCQMACPTPREDSGGTCLPGWGEGHAHSEADMLKLSLGCSLSVSETQAERNGVCPWGFQVSTQAQQCHGQTGASTTPWADVQS